MRKCFLLFLCLISLSACINISNLERGKLIPASSETVETSFSYLEGLIIMEAEVNRVTGRFLLDNGFSLSAVNQDFAEKAGIRFGKSANLSDANNTVSKRGETTVDMVSIGGHKFVKTGFYEINTHTFFPCESIDGVIGASIINKINWEVDFINQRMRISSLPFKTKGHKVDLMYSSNNSGFVNIEVNGKSARCKIDMGSTSDMKLDKDTYYDLFKGVKAEKQIGVLSLSANGLGKIDTFYNLLDKVAMLNKGKELPIGGEITIARNLKYDGYIGLKYLKQYTLTINSSQKHLLLSDPVNSATSDPSKSYGIALYLIDGNWKIIRLNPHDSLLDTLSLLDEVELLDGEPINRFKDICGYKEYLKGKAKNQEAIRIKLKKSDEIIELPYREVIEVHLP